MRAVEAEAMISTAAASRPVLADTRLFEQLRHNARLEDEGAEIGASVDLLRKAGWLAAALPTALGGPGLGEGGLDEGGIGEGGSGAIRSVRHLLALARVNLSLARLYEGHVNALALLASFGDEILHRRVAERVAKGALFGVWGADGKVPVTLAREGRALRGAKCFASGLGAVSLAVVTVDSGPSVRLCLVDTGDRDRQDISTWQMEGMKASASGSYDFEGVADTAFTLFGRPGCYLEEPGFLGGVWRIAAVQLGGTFGLIEAARDRLRALDRLEAVPQLVRLGGALQRALGVIGLVEKAAALAGSPRSFKAPEDAVALSAAARLVTEEIALGAITAAEQSVGLRQFERASESGRIARDLRVYIRQAARDMLMQRASRHLLTQEDCLALWYG